MGYRTAYIFIMRCDQRTLGNIDMDGVETETFIIHKTKIKPQFHKTNKTLIRNAFAVSGQLPWHEVPNTSQQEPIFTTG